MKPAPFIKSPETPEERKNRENECMIQSNLRKNKQGEIIKKHNLVILNSDYLGCDSYYIDKTTTYIWKVNNLSNNPIFTKLDSQEYLYIVKYNNLINNSYNIQPRTLQ
jgi:hypothetical protein